MTFTWHGFATVDDDSVVVGDVFQNQNLILTEDQAMELQTADGLAFEHVEPDAQYVGTSLSEANYVRWSGERQFLDGHPRAELTVTEGGPNSPVTAMTERADTSWLLVAGGLLVLAVAAGAFWYRRSGHTAGDSVGTPQPTASSSGDSEHGPATADSQPPQPGATDPSTGADTPKQPDTVAGVSPQPTLSEDDLLTDEDRVVKLIRENGGRMKQVKIVEETGWSKSKVSMLLSEMESDDTISKLRVGRENIISLEGFEPEATKSPFDEQE